MEHSTPPFTSLADLASARLGGRAVAANDEFFAPKSNLVKPEPAIFIQGKFTTRGKWMDGWESRRRRAPGHDWCVIKLGTRGRIHGVDVDTSFFTGNYPSHCSIDALDISPTLTKDVHAGKGGPWITILSKSSLRGDSHNYFEISSSESRAPSADSRVPGPAWTHVRLNIYPDGGVARLRVYGDAVVDWNRIARGGRPIDLAEIRNGGLVLGASDMHFGAKDNMIMPGRAANMGDGWETRRRRGPGHDWAIVRLGTTGNLRRVEIDTNHFKGNYPDSASLEGCLAPGASIVALGSLEWSEILPQTRLKPHHCHVFVRELRRTGPVSHVRLNIFPDGGISRLRVHGTVAKPHDVRLASGPHGRIKKPLALDRATPEEARAMLRRCSGSARWVERMLARLPFGTPDAMLIAAREEWFALSKADWRDAFGQHPRIGNREAPDRRMAATRQLSEQEQAGAIGASERVLSALANANHAYEKKFGYIFIICATGRSADEMLAALEARLHNDPDSEILIAAEEHCRITELRLLGL